MSIAIILTFWAVPIRAADHWLPVTEEDLSLKEVPGFPDAQAVVLYRSVERHDDVGYEEDYIRIKILKAGGMRYADVETPPFVRDYGFVGDIKARTIKHDGTIVPFTGRVFEKLILKNSSRKEVSLAFTLPGVEVGSIIEYRYKQRFAVEWAEQYGTEWRVQDDLYVKKASFSLRPSARFRVKWVASHLLDGAEPKQSGGRLVLNLENVPAFEAEEYMPPEPEVRARVYFYYVSALEPERTSEFWKASGEAWKKKTEKFMDQHQALRAELSQVLTPKDLTVQARMRRLYDRVQRIRNLSWRSQKQASEEESGRLKENSNVEDVLRHGYGTDDDINRLYAALLREAGIYAAMMRVPDRDESFFHPQVPRWEQLDSEIVVARDDDREYFLDPGTPYCPFGELPWQRTAVIGWRSDSMTWDEVPGISAESTTETHKAELTLNRDGTLTGGLQLTYTGQAALTRRLSVHGEDDTDKRRGIEEEIENWLPYGSRVRVSGMDGWDDSDGPLTININVTIVGLSVGSGSRMVLPSAILHRQDRYPFLSPKRIHNIYFRFPFSVLDDIAIRLPEQSHLIGSPEQLDVSTSFARFSSSIAQNGNVLLLRRELKLQNLMISANDYPKLQSFYARVKAADSEDMVVVAGHD